MNQLIYFKDMFESIQDYSQIVFLMLFLILKDTGLLNECGSFANDLIPFCKGFKSLKTEQSEDYFGYIKSGEEKKY